MILGVYRLGDRMGVFRRLGLHAGLGLGIVLQISAISSASAHHRGHQNNNENNNSVQAYSDQAPQCLDQSGNDLSIDNDQVMQWKTSTPNNYLNRAHVSGTVVAVYPDQTNHAHFGIQLTGENGNQDFSDASNSSNTLEVVYDLLFGPIPAVHVGDTVEACGDYITAYAQSGHYPPSPDGALIHWIHRSDSARHENGFLMINGSLYGQELPNN